MPTLNIDGHSVQVDDSFLKLSPEQQNATVEEIAGHIGSSQSKVAAAPRIEPEAADHGLSQRQQLSPLEKAVSPITSYPATYDRMNREARDQMSHGVDQIVSSHGVGDVAKGAGNAALGALGYVASPINAAYRSVVGQPVEDVTGIPREYTEFAAQLATPGIGLMSASKSAPNVVSKTVAPSIDELKTSASAGYGSPEVSNLVIKAQSLKNHAAETRSALAESGFDENIAPKTNAILKSAESGPANSFVTGRNLESLRKTLGKAAGSSDPSERAAASQALEKLQGYAENIDPADILRGDAKAASAKIQEANANYSAAKHAETIDNKTIQAELRAAAANSGMNVANTVRQRMADILIKPGLQRGFTQDELGLMDDIVRGTRGQNAIRYAGNFLGGGGLGSHVSAASGAALGSMFGPIGAAVGAAAGPGGGYALKSLANKMTLEQAGKLSEAIRSRAPLASSLEKFEVSAEAASKARNPKTLSAVVLASRNLSNNLRSSGFNISPGDLLKSLQSPSSAAADQQQ